MGIPTNPNQPGSGRYEQIKAPELEWVKNDPKTTKHLPCPSSSWLESISYDPGTQRMTVTTKNGASWQHGQVNADQFKEMQLHPSKGSYYTKAIKGQHPTTKIIKTPQLRDFPKETGTNEKPKDRFQNPLYDHFTRWKSKGRYA